MKMIVTSEGKWLNPKQVVTIEFRQVDSQWNAYAIASNDEEHEIASGYESEAAARAGVQSGGLEIIVIDDF